jgi:transcriptional regulator with XRE-family HTH domain
VETNAHWLQTVFMASEQEFLKSFGRQLASIRKQKGITQERLADLVEVHRTYIGFIEQGKRNPSIGNIYKISQALKVKMSELVNF